jgi:hypothetical protein
VLSLIRMRGKAKEERCTHYSYLLVLSPTLPFVLPSIPPPSSTTYTPPPPTHHVPTHTHTHTHTHFHSFRSLGVAFGQVMGTLNFMLSNAGPEVWPLPIRARLLLSCLAFARLSLTSCSLLARLLLGCRLLPPAALIDR